MRRFPGMILYSEKPGYRIARHLFLFVGMNLLFTWVVFMRSGQDQQLREIVRNVLINSFFFFGYAYLTAYVLVPLMLSKRRYILFFIVFLFAGIFISWLKFIFSDYLFYNVVGNGIGSRIEAASLSRVLVNTKDMTFIVALFLIAKYAKDNHHLNSRLAMFQDDQLRSEIRLLRNQLDPHVVFNNLNNLYCLSLNESPAVSANLGRLSSLLSFYFEDGKKEKVKLSRELEAIMDYLNLEKLRYGNRLSIDFATEGDPGEKEIFPLVIFPFVENCLEHGSSLTSGSAWIRIRVRVEADAIVFHASNSKPEALPEAFSQDRGRRKSGPAEKLDLLYPGRYMLRVDDLKDRYSVDFKLKL
ncbi:MAG: histidine kinase [Bacteroidales bacterium]|nr:histidine kinase [Bacteroidales bacterium]MDT8431401.1 histidine kinase [Bacteroidales bacterium]